MNDLGNEIFKALEILHLGSDKQQEKFTKGLAILQNKYSDFFDNVPNDKKLITDYFFISRPFSNSEAIGIKFIDYYKLSQEIESELVALWESIFPKLP